MVHFVLVLSVFIRVHLWFQSGFEEVRVFSVISVISVFSVADLDFEVHA